LIWDNCNWTNIKEKGGIGSCKFSRISLSTWFGFVLGESLHCIHLQLTNQTYGEAVAMLSQFTEATANNTEIQTTEVLNEVAIYFKELADFVNESQVIINITVSSIAHDSLNSRILQIKINVTIIII
jgi:hypothetical protein